MVTDLTNRIITVSVSLLLFVGSLRGESFLDTSVDSADDYQSNDYKNYSLMYNIDIRARIPKVKEVPLMGRIRIPLHNVGTICLTRYQDADKLEIHVEGSQKNWVRQKHDRIYMGFLNYTLTAEKEQASSIYFNEVNGNQILAYFVCNAYPWETTLSYFTGNCPKEKGFRTNRYKNPVSNQEKSDNEDIFCIFVPENILDFDLRTLAKQVNTYASEPEKVPHKKKKRHPFVIDIPVERLIMGQVREKPFRFAGAEYLFEYKLCGEEDVEIPILGKSDKENESVRVRTVKIQFKTKRLTKTGGKINKSSVSKFMEIENYKCIDSDYTQYKGLTLKSIIKYTNDVDLHVTAMIFQ